MEGEHYGWWNHHRNHHHHHHHPLRDCSIAAKASDSKGQFVLMWKLVSLSSDVYGKVFIIY
jgi:hypothetical protein